MMALIIAVPHHLIMVIMETKVLNIPHTTQQIFILHVRQLVLVLLELQLTIFLLLVDLHLNLLSDHQVEDFHNDFPLEMVHLALLDHPAHLDHLDLLDLLDLLDHPALLAPLDQKALKDLMVSVEVKILVNT
jgi:hypothetical protein